MSTIYLAANTNGIDAYIWPKAKTITESGIPLNRASAIGDECIDIAMLSINGLLAVGCPANAQQEVKDAVLRAHGLVSGREDYDGFREFMGYTREKATMSGLDIGEVVCFSDKDGVLCGKRDYSRGSEFAKLIRRSGEDYPLMRVITGSTVSQNRESGFMEAYGLTPDNLRGNSAIAKDPYIVLCENGSVRINVLDHRDVIVSDRLDEEQVRLLTEDCREDVMVRMEQELFPEMNLNWEAEYMRQKDNIRGVYAVPKKTMVTFNVPQSLRTTEEGFKFRKKVLNILDEEIRRNGFATEIVT